MSIQMSTVRQAMSRHVPKILILADSLRARIPSSTRNSSGVASTLLQLDIPLTFSQYGVHPAKVEVLESCQGIEPCTSPHPEPVQSYSYGS